jgi:uridine phosphorylase
METYPILEFDPTMAAIVNPHRPKTPKIPQHTVVCFFQHVFEQLIAHHQAQKIWTLQSEIGANPVYQIEINGIPLAIAHPGVGAPLAAGILDELIALGATKFIGCGGAGVLESSLALGHIVIPTSAIRDEGTSYHYLPPSREVAPTDFALETLKATITEHQHTYLLGKTWTTDAIFRETMPKIKRRREEGCLTVEMEAAAFFAVAHFRSVEFAMLLYSGDDVSGDKHDMREWDKQTSIREQLFWLAAHACVRL